MPVRLSTGDADFAAQFAAFLTKRGAAAPDVSETVRAILQDVEQRGDVALSEYTTRFDGFTYDAPAFTRDEIASHAARCEPEVVAALEHAAARVRRYHEKQLPEDYTYTDETGTRLGWRWNAIDAVGLYVPGGKASYPSSVLMNAIPAKVAGVPRLVMVAPTPEGHVNASVMAAAEIAGVDEIWRVGGAQAVAALAYGTATLASVHKIVGPGNAFVAEAKRQVFGRVGIDMIAGPSEILVLADAKNNPDWIAADLLSQAEHDEAAQAVLVTDDADFAAAVERAVEQTLRTLPRHEIARASWEQFGAIILVRDWQEAVALINEIAPEHLELAIDEPETLAAQMRHAGAIFLGRFAPEAVGDYLAGPSHVLPTFRTARFSSVLSVTDFMKRSSIIGGTAASLAQLAPDGIALAEAEGLTAHALSLRVRLPHGE